MILPINKNKYFSSLIIIMLIIVSPFFMINTFTILKFGAYLGLFIFLIDVFHFKSFFPYLSSWCILLFQCIILIYAVCYSLFYNYELILFLILIIFEILCVISHPMFSKLLFIITPFSSK